MRRSFAAASILLVFPDGRGGTWAHPGSPAASSTDHGRDDIAFTRAVLADVRGRWPVDQRLVWATGFSQGGSMVWDLACRGGLFAAYVPIAGDFWEPLPAGCPAGPADLLHIHGLADDTIPLEGRPLRGGAFIQGDLFASMAVMRTVNGCQRNPDSYSIVGSFVLRAWATSCASGKQLAMAIHPGGHAVPEGWFEIACPWVQRSATTPAALSR